MFCCQRCNNPGSCFWNRVSKKFKTGEMKNSVVCENGRSVFVFQNKSGFLDIIMKPRNKISVMFKNHLVIFSVKLLYYFTFFLVFLCALCDSIKLLQISHMSQGYYDSCEIFEKESTKPRYNRRYGGPYITLCHTLSRI